MKISISTYSFQQLIQKGTMSQLDTISKSKEMGIDAIEIMGIFPHDGSSVEEYARKIGEECRKAGMPVANYTTSADFLNGSNGDFHAEVERVKGEVDIAQLVGAKSIRHDATIGYPKEERGPKGFEDALPRLVEGCSLVTEYAASKGIRTMIENHGLFCQDSVRVEKLVNQVANANFGLLTDMGNFLCADEEPQLAIGRVAPYAFYVHAKDFHVKSGMSVNPGEGFFKTRGGNYLRGAVIGHGDVPVLQCLSILKAHGYDGYVGIEFEGIEEPLKAIRIGLDNLRRFIEMA